MFSDSPYNSKLSCSLYSLHAHQHLSTNARDGSETPRSQSRQGPARRPREDHSFCVLTLTCPPSAAPEVSVLHPVPFLTGPSLCGPLLVGAPREIASFFPNQRALTFPFAAVARCVDPIPDLTMRRPYRAPAPPAPPHAPDSNASGAAEVAFISPASRPDAGSALGHGKCSAHDWQHSPSSVRTST